MFNRHGTVELVVIADVWRSRVRFLEENVFANVLGPAGVEQSNWRELPSEDPREQTLKISVCEVTSRRLRGVYFPLISVLIGAWVVRLSVFGTATGVGNTATVGALTGEVVPLTVGLFYGIIIAVTFWPTRRQAKGELQSETNSERWR